MQRNAEVGLFSKPSRLKFTGFESAAKKFHLLLHRAFFFYLTHSVVVLGEFQLSKGNYYDYNTTLVGRNPQLDRNNIWISRNKLSFLQKEGRISTPESALKIIARKI